MHYGVIDAFSIMALLQLFTSQHHCQCSGIISASSFIAGIMALLRNKAVRTKTGQLYLNLSQKFKLGHYEPNEEIHYICVFFQDPLKPFKFLDLNVFPFFSRPFMKLCIVFCQKQICPPHFIYMAHLSGIYVGMYVHIYTTDEVTCIKYVTRRTRHILHTTFHWHISMNRSGCHITDTGHIIPILYGHINVTLVHIYVKRNDSQHLIHML